MSHKLFNESEMKQLAANPYVKSVSEKGITYTDEFKRHFIAENEKGMFPREIFEACGFNIEIIVSHALTITITFYYNHYRYQLNIKKITPVEYRNHLLRSA